MANAQTVNFNYIYRFEPALITEPPVIQGFPDVDYPEAARKNGVEGTVKVTLTMTETGAVSDITVVEGLPFGVSEAVAAGMKKFKFTPAKFNDKPVALKMSIDYTISIVFVENDSNVKKPVITDKPAPIYPESGRADKVKGKVGVQALFNADGTIKLIGVSSVLPKEFDKAALEAAKNLKFQPAVHKKSKKPVSQIMTVEFDFKP